MNQFALFHFTINKNDKIYQFVVQPGAPWEDIECALAEFQQQFCILKEEAQKQKEASDTTPNEQGEPCQATDN